jgi:hypothetical protein
MMRNEEREFKVLDWFTCVYIYYLLSFIYLFLFLFYFILFYFFYFLYFLSKKTSIRKWFDMTIKSTLGNLIQSFFFCVAIVYVNHNGRTSLFLTPLNPYWDISFSIWSYSNFFVLHFCCHLANCSGKRISLLRILFEFIL